MLDPTTHDKHRERDAGVEPPRGGRMTVPYTDTTTEQGKEHPDWLALLSSTPAPMPITADKHVEGPISQSFSRPHLYLGEDGVEYVVKFPRPGQRRAVASDQVVGRAGWLLGAAVGQVVAMRIDPELLPAGEDASAAGIAHGCRRVSNTVDGGIAHVDSNRGRFASLTVLYTWTHAGNHQLIYEQIEPAPVVYSVDHGHFLPPEAQWNAASLDAHPPPIALDPWFTSQGIRHEDCSEAFAALQRVQPGQVAEVVRSARMEWDVTDNDLLALCRYLWERREATLLLGGGG
jgi:hypothetical protein